MWLQSEVAIHLLQREGPDLPELARVNWRVLGPWGSDGLKAMVEETSTPATLGLKRVSYYSHYATVPDGTLLENKADYDGQSNLSDFLATKGVAAQDHRQRPATGLRPGRRAGAAAWSRAGWKPTRASRDRRRLRGRFVVPRAMRGPARRATSRWSPNGTRCGRTQPSARLHGEEARADPASTASTTCVGSMDRLPIGQVADSAPASDSSDTGKPGAERQGQQARRKDGTFVERAEGARSQFDYLRRAWPCRCTAGPAGTKDQSSTDSGCARSVCWATTCTTSCWCCRRLQPEFPNAIFFTTDLDARFLHPREQAWARNLLVASNFGLEPSTARLQGGAPPFRDSYQTSAFSGDAHRDETTRSAPASSTAPTTTADTPIGHPGRDAERLVRHGAHLRDRANHGLTIDGEDQVKPCRGAGLDHAASTSTRRVRRAIPSLAGALLSLDPERGTVGAVGPRAVAAGRRGAHWRCFVAGSHCGSHRAPGCGMARWSWAACCLQLDAALVAGLDVADLCRSGPTRDEQAAGGFRKASVLWPTEGIRLLALLLCLLTYLLLRGWTRRMDAQPRRDQRPVSPGPDATRTGGRAARSMPACPGGSGWLLLFSLEFVPRLGAPQTQATMRCGGARLLEAVHRAEPL